MKLKKNDVVLIRWKNYYNTGVHNNYELGVIKIIEDDEIRYLKLDMNPLSRMDKMFFNDCDSESLYYAPICMVEKVGEY